MALQSSIRWLLLGTFLLSWLSPGCFGGAQNSCENEGTCVMEAQSDLDGSLCSPETLSSIYGLGGSAQAYKSGAPVKRQICDLLKYQESGLRVSSWSFGRVQTERPAPVLTIQTTLYSCFASPDDGRCHVEPLDTENGQLEGVMEIWQTRPDGTYSSIRQGVLDGDCRATVPLNESSLAVHTVAPGSYGSLGGLGPYGIDFVPYGPPLIHFLVSAANHAPTLIDVPLAVDPSTLEEKASRWSDFRGPAWVKERVSTPAYKITAWTSNVETNTIDIRLDIYLRKVKDDWESFPLCESSVVGLPPFFFLEPISECAPSILDFFPL